MDMYNPPGASVVDYAVASSSLFHTLLDFQVMPAVFSDYQIIEVSMKTQNPADAPGTSFATGTPALEDRVRFQNGWDRPVIFV